MNETLWQLAEQHAEIESIVAEMEGELTEEMEAKLAALDLKFSDKIEAVALYVSRMNAEADAISAEIDRLKVRRNARERKAAWLKDYMGREMDKYGKPRVDGTLASVMWQANPPSVKGTVPYDTLVHWKQFASPFVTYTEEYALNKKAVLEAHKRGEPIPDEVEVTQTHSLRIR